MSRRNLNEGANFPSTKSEIRLSIDKDLSWVEALLSGCHYYIDRDGLGKHRLYRHDEFGETTIIFMEPTSSNNDECQVIFDAQLDENKVVDYLREKLGPVFIYVSNASANIG